MNLNNNDFSCYLGFDKLLQNFKPSEVLVEGGTHNPFAPPFDFFDRVFLPRLREMGADVEAKLERVGFYPAGGGEVALEVHPSGALRPVSWLERGEIERVVGTAKFANLPASIAEREREVLRKRLGSMDPDLRIQEDDTSPGPGNVVFVEGGFAGGAEICTGFAERGVRAEKVAKRAVDEFRRFVEANVPVGKRLADQLMIPMLMAGGGAMRTMPLSQHSRTNLEVIERFVSTPIRVTEEERGTLVEIGEQYGGRSLA